VLRLCPQGDGSLQTELNEPNSVQSYSFQALTVFYDPHFPDFDSA